jgi:hypothetical protein
MARFVAAPAAALVTIVVSLAAAAVAHAGPGGATVTGTVSLPPPSQRGAPPIESQGFVPRAKNPLKPVKAYNPLSSMVVVLEGGPVAADDRTPPGRPASYKIIGESFSRPVMPVQVGREIEIENRGRNSPRLFSPDQDDLLAGDPLNPRGIRSAKVARPYQAIRVRDRDSAHLQGILVAFPHPYFSRVDDAGRFEIAGVPAGTWRARIWYRNGWLDIKPKPVKVSGHGHVRVGLAVPPNLDVTVPDKPSAGE